MPRLRSPAPSSMKITLEGKTGVVLGVANKRSIARASRRARVGLGPHGKLKPHDHEGRAFGADGHARAAGVEVVRQAHLKVYLTADGDGRHRIEPLPLFFTNL